MATCEGTWENLFVPKLLFLFGNSEAKGLIVDKVIEIWRGHGFRANLIAHLKFIIVVLKTVQVFYNSLEMVIQYSKNVRQALGQ